MRTGGAANALPAPRGGAAGRWKSNDEYCVACAHTALWRGGWRGKYHYRRRGEIGTVLEYLFQRARRRRDQNALAQPGRLRTGRDFSFQSPAASTRRAGSVRVININEGHQSERIFQKVTPTRYRQDAGSLTKTAWFVGILTRFSLSPGTGRLRRRGNLARTPERQYCDNW